MRDQFWDKIGNLLEFISVPCHFVSFWRLGINPQYQGRYINIRNPPVS